MRLGHVTIRTDELEATREFFTDVLGLSVGERPAFRFPGYWLYGDGRPLVHLVVASPERTYVFGADRLDVDGGTGAIDHIAFEGDDYDALIARLKRAELDYTARAQTGTGVRQVFVTGPHGVVVEVDFAAVA